MKVRRNPFLKLLSLLLVFLLAAPLSAVAETAGATPASTSITVKGPTSVVPGKRVTLSAEVTDPAGIELVRCYFRSAGEADYVFVPMSALVGATYAATLPAPAATTTAFDYVVLAVTGLGVVVKTATTTVAVDSDATKATPGYQQVTTEGQLQVSTELSQAPPTVAGFSDNLTVDVVESGSRFMLVSGAGAAGLLTSSGSAAGTTAATTTATTSVSSATIMGIKAATFWWIVAGVVAVAAGTAVAASSSGGGGGGAVIIPTKTGSVTAHW